MRKEKVMKKKRWHGVLALALVLVVCIAFMPYKSMAADEGQGDGNSKITLTLTYETKKGPNENDPEVEAIKYDAKTKGQDAKVEFYIGVYGQDKATGKNVRTLVGKGTFHKDAFGRNVADPFEANFKVGTPTTLDYIIPTETKDINGKELTNVKFDPQAPVPCYYGAEEVRYYSYLRTSSTETSAELNIRQIPNLNVEQSVDEGAIILDKHKGNNSININYTVKANELDENGKVKNSVYPLKDRDKPKDTVETKYFLLINLNSICLITS